MKVTVFEYPKGAFDENKVITFIGKQLSILDNELDSLDKEIAKDRLNLLCDKTFSRSYSKKVESILHLRFCYSLVLYAQQHNNVETCNNVLERLKESKLSNYAGTKLPYLYRYTLSICYFVRFNISKLRDGTANVLNQSDLLDLIKSKNYLYKIYNEHKSLKLVLGDNKFSEALTLLIAVLSQLSRWPEALNLIDTEYGSDMDALTPMVNYIKAQTLSEIQEKTCLNHNGLLLYKTLLHCNYVLDQKESLGIRISQKVSLIKGQIISQIEKNNLDLVELSLHNSKERITNISKSRISVFLHDKRLFLNEHQFFCNCENILGDDLTIQTSHDHTKIDWVKYFEMALSDMKSDFTLARVELFKSKSGEPLDGYQIKSFDRSNESRKALKLALLKSSFRRCYSILDKISSSLLKALDVDMDNILNDDGNKIPVYFFNVWDLGVIKDEDFKRNRSLHSLYSIAKDLDRSKLSALKQFKSIRNSIEHGMLKIISGNGNLDSDSVSLGDLNTYTMLLIKITRSAIFSYAYFVRIESISRAKEKCA